MTSYSGTPDIMTISGRFFQFLDPQPDQICIEDIAHALAFTCRFAGHTQQYYSVAQHSWLASTLCPREDALWGLLHDASEAYLTDIPRPIKRVLPEYKDIESTVMHAIAKRFGLLLPIPNSVKTVDGVLLATEGRDLCGPGWEYWGLPHQPLERAIVPWAPELAREMFLERYNELSNAA